MAGPFGEASCGGLGVGRLDFITAVHLQVASGHNNLTMGRGWKNTLSVKMLWV